MEKSYIIVIVGLMLSGILLPMLNYSTSNQMQDVQISDVTYFDPVCKDKQIFTFDYLEICHTYNQYAYILGSSSNIDNYIADNVNNAKILFIKIPLSGIPKSTLFNEVSIVNVKLILHTKYDAPLNSTFDNEFGIYNGLCQHTSWSANTNMTDLPCIGKDKNIVAELKNFLSYQKSSLLQIVNLDIGDHVNYALQNKLDSFTELVEFDPKQFEKNSAFDQEERTCLYSATNISEMNNCIRMNAIAVYGLQHPTEGLRPKLTIEYNVTPTGLEKILVSIGGLSPTIISVLIFLYSKKDEYDFTLDKFTEKETQYVGIRNHANKTIKSCVILCENMPCAWSRSNRSSPRHFAGGEADNALIPKNYENINPLIKVVSKKKTLEEIRLDDIVSRY